MINKKNTTITKTTTFEFYNEKCYKEFVKKTENRRANINYQIQNDRRQKKETQTNYLYLGQLMIIMIMLFVFYVL